MIAPFTILIVDDCEDDQILYRRALRPTGFRLVQACTAHQGLLLFAQEHPGAILLDFNLPDQSGLGFMEQLAEAGASVPIVMLTGEGNEAIAVSAMKAGVSDYLAKDVEGDYLRLLPSVIHRARMAHEERQRAHRLGILQEAILRTVADGIVGVDADGVVLFANPAAERMLHYPDGMLPGCWLTDLLRPEDPLADWLDHPLAQPHDGTKTVRCETDQFERVGGTSFPAAYTASSLDFEGTGKFGWVLVFRDITERKQVEEELIKTARYDPLTGLPNRLMFQDYFARCLSRTARQDRPLALLFLDLDGFKQVNDLHGHLVGDQLLQIVAQRLVKCVRGGDLVSRFGGDEFTIVLEDCDPALLPVLGERINCELAEAFDLSGQSVTITASIGIALHPQCGADAHTLIQKADAAMYEAKRRGKSFCALCPELESFLKSI